MIGEDRTCAVEVYYVHVKVWKIVRLMTKASSKSWSQNSPAKVRLTGVVGLSRAHPGDPFSETYWTEKFEVSAYGKDGRRLFEAFHILAVPESQLTDFERLRSQARRSFLSGFKESIQSLRHSGYARKRWA